MSDYDTNSENINYDNVCCGLQNHWRCSSFIRTNPPINNYHFKNVIKSFIEKKNTFFFFKDNTMQSIRPY